MAMDDFDPGDQEKYGKCQQCKKRPGRHLHHCPFECEVHDNPNKMCNCCDYCEQDCLLET